MKTLDDLQARGSRAIDVFPNPIGDDKGDEAKYSSD